MDKKFGTDLTVGSIPRHLLGFSLPMLAGNLIQIGHSLINTIWVGQLVGENGVGAIGVSFPVFMILIGFAMGMSMATTILVSQYFGAKEQDTLSDVVNNSFSLTLILGVTLSVTVALLTDPILTAMKTPPENFAMASTYLKITLGGFILLYMTFTINSVLRGIGDTVTPLIFMAIGIGTNIVLDPFFIGGWGPFPSFGLTGAAWATLLSQGLALAITLFYLNRKSHLVAFSFKRLILNRRMTGLLFKIGLPSIAQQALVSLGMLFIVSFVNAFGAAATNAFGAVTRIDMFAVMPAMSISMAMAALTGQNLGAQKPERVKSIFKWGVIMNSAMSISISLVMVLFSRTILTLFGLGEDVKALEMGINYLRIVGSCYILFSVGFACTGIVNGSGHTMVTMIFTLLSLWLLRIPLAWSLSKTGLGINGIWMSMSLSFFGFMTISLIYFFSGKWKKSVIMKTPTTVPIIE